MDHDLTTVIDWGGAFGGEVSEPTINLRFMHGRLQQGWLVRGAVSRIEWRDVPDATPAPREEPTNE